MQRMVRVLIFVFLLCAIGSADEVGGRIFFGTGPTGVPVRWRNDGRREGFHVGAEFLHKGARCEWGFFFLGSGAAKFDNLDFAQFGPRAGCRIFSSRFTAEIVNWNGAPLAARPAPDMQARRPDSYLNNTWAGVRYNFRPNRIGLTEFHYWHGIRGDLPLFSPKGATRPYATQYISVSVDRSLRGIGFRYRPEIFLADQFTGARITNTLEIRHPIYRSFIGLVEASSSNNFGTNIPGANRLAVGFEMPFRIGGTNPEKQKAIAANNDPHTDLISAFVVADRISRMTADERAVLRSLLETHSVDLTATQLGMNTESVRVIAKAAQAKALGR